MGKEKDGEVILWGLLLLLMFSYLYGCVSANATKGPVIIEDYRLTSVDLNEVLGQSLDSNYLRLDTTNDPLTNDLTINGDLYADGVMGGTAAGESLDLNANSQPFSFANTGRINFNERMAFSPTVNSDGYFYGLTLSPDVTASGAALNVSSWLFGGGTITATTNPLFGSSFQMFYANPTVQTQTATVKVPALTTFGSAAVLQADGVASGTTAFHAPFYSKNNIRAINSGTQNITTWSSFRSEEIISPTAGGTVNIGTLNAFDVINPSKSGAGTENITTVNGLNIPSLTAGTSNNGILSAMSAGANNRFINHTGTADSNFGGGIQVGKTLVAGGPASFSDIISVAENKPVYFDTPDTYIYANTDNPEDLVVGANQDIILEPDDDVIINGVSSSTGLDFYSSTGGTYSIMKGRANNAEMAFQKTTGLTPGQYGFYSSDGDGTSDVSLRLYLVGLPGTIGGATESLILSANSTAHRFAIQTAHEGGGNVRDLYLFTAGNYNQITELWNQGHGTGMVGIMRVPEITFDVNGSTRITGDLNVVGDLNVGTLTQLRYDGNITMTSPDGSPWNCGVTNGGIFQCT